MFEYTFSKVSKFGELDVKFGQTYWAEVHEHLQPVMFNSMNEDIDLDDKIVAEERSEKKSSKGTMYYRLKKVRVVGKNGSDGPKMAQGDSSADVRDQLNRIEAKLDKLLGQDAVTEPTPEQLDGEPVSLDDIPF